MKIKLLTVVALFFFSLIFSVASFAQCQGGANGPIPDYAFYATMTTVNGGTTLTANVTVSGETTGAAGCMGSGQHTPETYIKIASNTALLQKGTPVSPTSYLTFTGGQSATVTVGTVYDLEEEAIIFCSVLDGDFWIVNGPPQFEIAYERSASLGTRTGCVTTSGVTRCY